MANLRRTVKRTWRRKGVHLLAPFLRPGDPARCGRIVPAQLRRVLIVRPQKLGDAVVTLPVADALRTDAPGVRIDYLASERSRMVLAGDPRFDRVFVLRKAPAFLETARRLRARGYDAILDLVDGDTLTGLMLAHACAGPRSAIVGVAKRAHASFYDGVTTPSDEAHGIERGLGVLDLIGIDSSKAERLSPPHYGSDSLGRVDRFLGSAAGAFAVNLSAGSPSRVWPAERAAALVGSLIDRARSRTTTVVLICVPADRRRAEAVRDLCGAARPLIVPDGFSIQDVTALLARMALLVSPDTSLIHIARSLDVPVVGLYPKMTANLRRWAPYGQSKGVVESPSGLSIADIDPAAVLRAIVDLRAI